MIKPDSWIKQKVREEGMIDPFFPEKVSEVNTDSGRKGVISFGCSSYGYDVRLSAEEFYIFRHVPGEVVDPKHFNPNHLECISPVSDESGTYFVIPGGSFALGRTVESFRIPSNVFVKAVGKSTYARVSIVPAVTPLEPGWVSNSLTLEIANQSASDCKVYAGEGICQLNFYELDPCEEVYQGKYNHQTRVTFAKV